MITFGRIRQAMLAMPEFKDFPTKNCEVIVFPKVNTVVNICFAALALGETILHEIQTVFWIQVKRFVTPVTYKVINKRW